MVLPGTDQTVDIPLEVSRVARACKRLVKVFGQPAWISDSHYSVFIFIFYLVFNERVECRTGSEPEISADICE
jgi:hypothetical protein